MPSFTWKVATEGYHWSGFIVAGLPGVQPVFPGCKGPTSLKALVPIEWTFRTYEPLKEHTGLFRTFGNLPPTLEAVQAFANEYGHLGNEFEYRKLLPVTPVLADRDRLIYEQGKDRMTIPQTFWEWEEAILRMRNALDLWDGACKRQASDEDFRELDKVVNDQLGNVGVIPRFEFKKLPSRGPMLQFVPCTLGGAMWLQLAQAIANRKKHRACESCGRWFELSPDIARTSKHYCAESCRSRAYRSRKERARQLFAAGKKLRKIADELGSDVETVKKWVAR